MGAVQRCVVDRSDAIVFAESGNSFVWANRLLRFATPGRYRSSLLWGSLGHASAAAIGLALGRTRKVVILTGDGGMLFTHELSTAVAHELGAIWIVLNDAGYGSCLAGQTARGLSTRGLAIPRVDFAAYARALGAAGKSAHHVEELDALIERALLAKGPFVLDVWLAEVESPLAQRFESFFGSAPRVLGDRQ
jgi:acetolactate synthase-1/2/3 large subunit